MRRHINEFKMRRLLFMVCYGVLTSLTAFAQVGVESMIDPVQILVGEQAKLTITVSMKDGQHAKMPSFQPRQFIVPGVEVLGQVDGDTVRLSDGTLKVARTYTLTSFDDTLYYLPPMQVEVDGKQYSAKTPALKVLTIEVDTLHPNQFYPPKTIQDNPFKWSDWKGVFWMSVLLLLLALVGYYLFIRLRSNKPVISRIKFVKRLLPHQKAMNSIEKLKAEHASGSEDQKTYYTRLTDTLRTYLEERFGFSAMEMTSGEIIERLKQEDSDKIAEMAELFETADLVKFAKYSTLINENDRNMAHVVEFIESTKKENEPTIERIEPKLSDDDLRTRRARRILKVVIGIVAAITALILAYVIWQIILLMA